MADQLALDFTQRWRNGRDRYRQRGADFRPGDFGVEPIASDRVAKAFVVEHHYARSYPAARVRVGLYRRAPFVAPELVGVAVFSVPMQSRAIAAYAPGLGADEGVELGRLVLLDEVPFNAETWFLARAFAAMRALLPRVRLVLSYSDPIARAAEDGRVVTPGHVGCVYQSKGARYVGRSRAETLHLDAAGRVVSRRSLSKIRLDERGAAGCYARLLAAGAPPRRLGEEGDAYVARALAEGPFRRMRHPGNHTYLFNADGTGLEVPSPRPALAYPKKGWAA